MHTTADITIRPSHADDQVAVRRLAALDSAPVPREPLLLAEVGGELRAAISLRDGARIADPFHRTAQLVELLELRGAQRSTRRQRRGPLRTDRFGPFARAGTQRSPARG
jgi:hypothetical protein